MTMELLTLRRRVFLDKVCKRMKIHSFLDTNDNSRHLHATFT